MSAPPDLDSPTAQTPGGPVRPRGRALLMTVWAVAFVAYCFTVGIPTDPVYAFGWLWVATIAWNPHLPWRHHARFIRDWAAIIVLLIAYNYSRGLADNEGSPHAAAMIHADTHLLGWATGGQLPTVWLQAHLYDPSAVHWWDLLVSAVYFSHFLTAPTIAIILWVRDRRLWAAFMRRWIALFAAGLATYFLYPAAPPWWAAAHGLIEPVARISTRGWSVIGLRGASTLLNAAQVDVANPVAAMPSLHTAFATLCAGFFLPRVRPRWRPLLLCYPAAMMFTLVYSAEHWVIDTLMGIAYATVILVAGNFFGRLTDARRDTVARDSREAELSQ